MPAPGSIEKIGDEVVRFRTAKFGVAVYRQRYDDGDAQKYSRSFYFGKTIAGKLTRFPVGWDMKKAEKLAEEIAAFLTIPSNTIDQALAQYNPRKAARMNHVPTFQEIIDAYERALPIIGRRGSAVSETSFKGYKSFLFTMLRKVEAYREKKEFESYTGRHHIDYSPWFSQPIDILTTKFAMDFKLSCMPPVPEGEEEPDEDEALTAKITADTTLRSARSLFSKQALRYFKEVGLNLPDLTGFMTEPLYGARKYFQLLPPDVITSMMRASLSLRDDDEDVYRAFLLCMHCGLRRGEAIAFKPHWLRQEDRCLLFITISGKFSPKAGHGRKAVIEPWVFETLKELGPVKDAAALDRLNVWSKALIPKEFAVSKANHEMRKMWISMKSKTEGILAASQQAGHRDPKVTATHYSDNLLSDKLLPFWKGEKSA